MGIFKSTYFTTQSFHETAFTNRTARLPYLKNKLAVASVNMERGTKTLYSTTAIHRFS
jgi:hypothetical protein